MSGRSGFQTSSLVILLAVVAAVAWYGIGPGAWFEGQEVETIKGAKVQRGPLRISVVEQGELEAADAVKLKSEIEGQTTILYLIGEGKRVEAGDLLCELDATSLIDRRVQQEITVRNAEAAFVKSKQNYEIQESQNKSDTAKAEQNLEFAKQDLLKFIEGERGSRLDEGRESITLSNEEFIRAKDKLDWSEKLASKGFLTATELEGDRLARNRSEIMLEQAKRDFELLEKYTLPRDEAELRADVEEAGRELERVRLQAKARIVDFDADMRTNEAKLKLEQEQLAKYEAQIEKARIYAPRAGMVVYAKQQGGGRYGSSEPIEEGTSVRERQEIITIPSASGMTAKASLHESVLKQVQPGMNVIVKVDALRDTEFQGRVSYVAVLPDQQSFWANPNARLYRTDVKILNGNEEMRPGMSCSVEILVEDIADTLYVPVQAVFRHEGKNLSFVDRGGSVEHRPVEVGRYNDRWVQILEGLEEGETVLLSPPRGFTPKPGESEATSLEGGGLKADTDTGSGAESAGPTPTARGEGEGERRDQARSEEGGERPRAERGERGERDGGGERGQGGMFNMTDEQRAAFREAMQTGDAKGTGMTQEEFDALRERMRSRSGGGGEGGGARGGSGEGSGSGQ